ncbi:helix-turn-helix domain-containing protein [Gracilibacillus sp. S3-1-1]|uniref:Helix-turn-helix domain-containing protein n=1 Tax=Gracilibacillus pellucidus TaxID=3095368 RepID=A0ACC6M549_9BACI|nr:helix-turn-helix domain-containing protein [Gracilibacillus sp. S3-1-1]MDX8046093.1 helix-turn-helix domain-containing protein [Gracilibacillus sp. S3-1-1]
MFEFILLDSIVKLNGERTIYNIFHLLTAKKSTQTVQDSNLFDLTKYFGVYKSLARAEFNQKIQQFMEQDIIQLNKEKQTADVTENGKVFYQQLKAEYEEAIYLNGAKYQDVAARYSLHLLLFIQTITHLHVNKHRFIPIIEDIETQKFIKRLWKLEQKKGTERLLHDLYQDLNDLLIGLPDTHAGVFVDSLTSQRKVGLSKYQVANKYQLTHHDVQLMFTNVIHAICTAIENGKDFAFLHQLYVIKKEKPLLSNSANQTLYYMEHGLSVEEIAHLRHLKQNTIMDHIVEIAYVNKTFNWSTYITKEQIALIKEALSEIQSKKLKEIKSKLPESISYFHIKLVMALGYKETIEERDYV